MLVKTIYKYMMSTTMFFVFVSRICFVLLISVTLVQSLNHANYGPYVSQWYNLEICHGPKTRNLTSFSMVINREKNNTYKIDCNVTFLEAATFETVKIAVFPLRGRDKAAQWKYKIDQPCKHPVLVLALKDIADIRKCNVLKGFHRIDINMSDMVTKFLGTEFFYGEFLFKVMVIAKRGNIACFQYIIKFAKPTKN